MGETADALDVGAARPIPRSELELRFTRSGGPGGQHVNTTATRAELVFDLAGSPSLTAAERRRAASRLGGRLDSQGRLRVVASDERSQLRNRGLAERRLVALLRWALQPPSPKRKRTRPTRAATEQRLESKRRTGQRKRLRRPPDPE
jgi:ribosome-associated protein